MEEEKKKDVQKENMEEAVARALKKKAPNNEEIAKLSRSEVVSTVLKASLQTPQTGSQFERDYNSLKTDIPAKLHYLLNTVSTEDVIKKIFKASLESDILMDIVKVFSETLSTDLSKG